MKCLALPLLMLAAPAFAGTFTPPSGCTTKLTVQSRGCIVSQFYTCEADAPGDQWRADFGGNGPFFLSKIDAEAQWLESYEFDPQTKETMDANPPDPASFSELLAKGLDTFNFSLSKSDGTHSTVKGFDKLTGQTAVIDGVTLKQTEYEYTQTDDNGTVMRHSRGHEYISEEWRTFFSGHSEYENEDGSWTPGDNAPVKFIRPGKPGFGATLPLFECDDQMSSLPGGLSVTPTSLKK
ncbi:hypothetical protein GC209_06050 [bacterium]|nr:hypothetical protein [bacterium]